MVEIDAARRVHIDGEDGSVAQAGLAHAGVLDVGADHWCTDASLPGCEDGGVGGLCAATCEHDAVRRCSEQLCDCLPCPLDGVAHRVAFGVNATRIARQRAKSHSDIASAASGLRTEVEAWSR